MRQTLNVLLVADSNQDLKPVLALLEDQPRFTLDTLVAGNGHQRSLADLSTLPDAIVLVLKEDWKQSLWGMVNKLPSRSHPFFVVSPTTDVDLLRAAMRAGARDLFAPPFNSEDIAAAIAQIAEEERMRSGAPSAHLVAFLNTKGGSGASFLAANVGHLLATSRDTKTVLVDLDFQFGGLPTYVNMTARGGLIRALELVDSLDEAALQGYVQTHESGLHLLAAAMDEIILPEEVGQERTEKLLQVLDSAYQTILVDLPRRIDASTLSVLSSANTVVLLTQQTVAHLHDTKRMLRLLKEQLGISAAHILLIVNRYSKKAEVELGDFSKLMPGMRVETLPADYKRVTDSINLGVPICEGAPRSAIAKRMVELADVIASPSAMNKPPKHGRGVLSWLNRSDRG